jgi:putative ABC transport system permease protein
MTPPKVSVMATQVSAMIRRPARVLLIGLSLLIAAFLVFATVLVQGVAERTVIKALGQTPPEVSVVVQAAEAPVDQDALAAIRGLPAVAEAVGEVSAVVEVAQNGTNLAMEVAADPGSGPFARVRVTEGAYPKAPGEVAVTQRTADRQGLRPGRRIDVASTDSTDGKINSAVLITAIVETSRDSGFSMYTHDEYAARISGHGFDRINVTARPGADIATLRQAIAAHLPSGSQAPSVRDAAAVRAEEEKAMSHGVKSLFAVIGVFLVVAVIAAAIVASSTYRVVFAQRTRQLALLRAVGAGRGPLIRAMVVEGAVIGLLTGAVGVVAAYALIHALIPALAWFDVHVQRPDPAIGAAVAIVLGTGAVSLACVLAPAISASKVPPLEALRTSSTSNSRTRIGAPRVIFGILCALAAAASATLAFLAAPEPGEGTEMGLLLLIILSGTAAYGVLIAFGPRLLPLVIRVVEHPIKRTGPVGALAVGGVGGAPRRAASVSAVVALGVALVSAVLVGSASMRARAETELAAAAPADFQVSSAEEGKALPAELAQRLAERGELAHVTPYRVVYVNKAEWNAERATIPVSDLNISTLPHAKNMRTVAGSLSDVAPGRVAVGWDGATVGQRIRLQAGDHLITVEVIATLSGGLAGGEVIAHPSDLDRLGAPTTPAGVLADAAKDGEAGRTAALAAIRDASGGADFGLQNLADGRDDLARELTLITTIVLGLLGLTILIAVVGVGTTTALSVVERARESGLLRALGLPRAGLRRMVTGEAALYGLIGSAFGLAIGIPYAWLMVRALGLGLPTLLPAAQLAVMVVVVTTLTALSGVLPAHRAAKASPIEAIATE